MVKQQLKSGHSLTILFLFMAVIAVILAVFSGSVKQARSSGNDIWTSMSIGLLFMPVVGAIIGIYHHRRLRGFLIGGAVGLISGPFLGAMVAHSDPARSVISCLSGSLLLIASGLAGLAMQHRRLATIDHRSENKTMHQERDGHRST